MSLQPELTYEELTDQRQLDRRQSSRAAAARQLGERRLDRPDRGPAGGRRGDARLSGSVGGSTPAGPADPRSGRSLS